MFFAEARLERFLKYLNVDLNKKRFKCNLHLNLFGLCKQNVYQILPLSTSKWVSLPSRIFKGISCDLNGISRIVQLV